MDGLGFVAVFARDREPLSESHEEAYSSLQDAIPRRGKTVRTSVVSTVVTLVSRRFGG